MTKVNDKKGIALLIAVVAVSALLLIALAISDIAYKEQILSYSGKESKVAFYAADSGMECLLYHDIGFPGFFFATSGTDLGLTPAPMPTCNQITPVIQVVQGPEAATTTFGYNISTSEPKACVVIRVVKTTGAEGLATKIEARGYNNTCGGVQGCTSNLCTEPDIGLRNVERALRINY